MTTPESKEQKAARLAIRGYHAARQGGKCCLCSQKFATGQYVGRLPASWRPTTKLRHAHYKCVEQLRAQIMAKAAALGVAVPAGVTR